jgi:hypothetical protein
MTRDLANRTVITRIKKQPVGYAFEKYAEGDVVAHVRAQTDHYLSCIYTVLDYWIQQGKPMTEESRHDFREWTQAMDWIVQHAFGLAPLMDGHLEEQERVSNPDLGWLRQVALAAAKDGRLDEAFKPSEIADLCDAHGIDIPGVRPTTSTEQIKLVTGKVLGRIFREKLTVRTGGFEVTRETRKEWNEDQRREVPVHYHWVRNIKA